MAFGDGQGRLQLGKLEVEQHRREAEPLVVTVLLTVIGRRSRRRR
ncbi:hypothetical protein [Dactylosporangium sp. CA-139066]